MISSPMKTRLANHVSAPVADAMILDDAAVVPMLNPGTSRILQLVWRDSVCTIQLCSSRTRQPYRPFLVCVGPTVYLPVGRGETRQRVASSSVKPKN